MDSESTCLARRTAWKVACLRLSSRSLANILVGIASLRSPDCPIYRLLLEGLSDRPLCFCVLVDPILDKLFSESIHLVFYVVSPLGPTDLRSLASQLPDFADHPRSPSCPPPTFQIVPSSFVYDSTPSAFDRESLLPTFVLDIYDRLHRPVERLVPRPLFSEEDSIPRFTATRQPAVTLAQRSSPKAAFDLAWPPPSLNRLDDLTMLHIAYDVSSTGWLVAVVVDEHGQELEVAVWKMAGEGVDWDWVIGKIWLVVDAVLKRQEVEWRIVLTRVGQFQPEEVDCECRSGVLRLRFLLVFLLSVSDAIQAHCNLHLC